MTIGAGRTNSDGALIEDLSAIVMAATLAGCAAPGVNQGTEQTHLMHVAVSGSGARYIGDGMEWWTKGTGAGAPGTLLRHRADDTTGAVIESCVQTQGRSP